MKTIEAANGKWGLIYEYFGLPPVDAKNHFKGECPVCSARGKLRIDDKDGDGSWICVHGAGKGFELLQEATGREFQDLAKEVDRLIGNTFETDGPPEQPVQQQLSAKAAATFKGLGNLQGTDGQTYLASRGITLLPRGGVKWNPSMTARQLGRTVAGLYAIASDPLGNPGLLHCTYIENCQKMTVSYKDEAGEETAFPARKMFTLRESQAPLAIKLFGVAEVMGFAEGIETALAASQLYRMPVWALLNASLMRRFRPPPGVKTAYWFADNDGRGTGIAAAMHAASASLHAKNDCAKCVIRWPSTVNDFNNVLTDGDSVYEWEMGR